MANKIAKLTMLSMLFSTALGLGLTNVISNTTPSLTKQAVSYATEDDLNDHTHDSSWISLEQKDFDTDGDYESGTLAGGSSESGAICYYLNENVTLSSNDITTSNYVTLCLNGKTLTGTVNTSVISVSQNAYFNLCDCSGNDSGIITGGKAIDGGAVYVTNSTFTMYGGTISGNESSATGGGIYSVNSTFTMYGGTISGNESSGNGGGIYLLDLTTFTMYGGTISGNKASSGGGGIYSRNSTFDMYGGTISNNEADNGGGVTLYIGATFNMYGGTITKNTDAWFGGGVYLTYDGSSSSTFNMYNGTISDNETTFGIDGIRINSNCSFYMYGGYLGNNIQIEGGTYTITGGYFTNNPNDYITSSGYQVVDISLIGSDLDTNYVAGFDYAVYTTSTSTYSIEDVTVETYGASYVPTISGGSVTGVAYTYSDGANTISGLPTDIGEYTVTAHILYTTTEEYLTTNYYATAEFKVTISNKGQAVISADATQSKTYDGEVASVDYTVIVGDTDITSDATVTETWYDENSEPISAPTDVGTYTVTLTVADTDNYYGASTDVTYTITENSSSASTDSTGLSAGAIAGIVIASVFVVGVIAFLVYFFVFRKRKEAKSRRKEK